MIDECMGVLKAEPGLMPAGFPLREAAQAVARAIQYDAAAARLAKTDLKRAVEVVRASRWPKLTKAVSGGFNHVVSVDNPAGYAELWTKPDGNWYAVTGAMFGDDDKIAKSSTGGIYAIPRVHKGASIDHAAARFMAEVFGPSGVKAGGCGCKGEK